MLYRHILKLKDVLVVKKFEKSDFSQSRDWKL